MAKKLEMSNGQVEAQTGHEEAAGKPVSEGDPMTVEIEGLGDKGDGIARIEGYVLFVPGAEVGETYEIKVDQVGAKFGFGEIV